MKRPKKNHSGCNHEGKGGFSRRQFLARAGVSSAALTFSPFLCTMFGSKDAKAVSLGCAVINLHLAGGWSSNGAIVPTLADGSLMDPSLYPTVAGVPSNVDVNTQLGVAMFHKRVDGSVISPFTDGVLSKLTAAELPFVRGVGGHFRTGNDNTPGAICNPSLAMAQILSKNGVSMDFADIVDVGLGTGNIVSYPAARKLIPNSVNSLLNAASFSKVLLAQAQTAGQTNSNQMMHAFTDGLKNYITAGMKNVPSSGAAGTFQNLLTGAATGLKGQVDPPQGSDPTTLSPVANATFGQKVTTLFGLNPNNFGNSPNDLRVTAAFNTLLGNKYAVCNLQMGGYDYHGGSRSSTDAMDMAAGQFIGALLALAIAMGRDLIVNVTTDGGLEPNLAAVDTTSPNDVRWSGDGNNKMNMPFFFANGSSTKLAQQRKALGAATANGLLASTPFEDSRVGTSAVIANWAKISGMSDASVQATFSAAGLSQADIDLVMSSICFV